MIQSLAFHALSVLPSSCASAAAVTVQNPPTASADGWRALPREPPPHRLSAAALERTSNATPFAAAHSTRTGISRRLLSSTEHTIGAYDEGTAVRTTAAAAALPRGSTRKSSKLTYGTSVRETA